MVKKLGLTSLIFSSSKVDSASSTSGGAAAAPSSSSSMSVASSWQWPSCKQPRTLSFRQQQHTVSKQAYNTMNSAYLPDSADSCFSNSFASVDSLSTTASEVDANERDAVIRALRSDRIFFEPYTSPATSSILSKAKLKKVKAATTCSGTSCRDDKTAAFEGATAMTMESSNPYRDFRASMEEMVMSQQGVKDWRWLEEMLGWYLRANGKSTHGLIVGAFVDLLVALSDVTTDSPSSPTTATNCSSSSARSSLRGTGEIKEE